MHKDFKKLFSSVKVTSKKGGSVASDSVMSSIRGGERFPYRLHHGSGPIMGLPSSSLNQPVDNMSYSMATNYAQPLTPNIPHSTTTMLYPSYYASFYPLLTQSGGRCNKK